MKQPMFIMSIASMVMTLSLSASAQYGYESRVAQEAQDVAREVSRESSAGSLSRTQENQIMEHLRAIRRIVRNEYPGNGGGNQYPDRATYTCVARDNDDRAPWVIGVREGLNVVRIREVTWGTKEACQTTLNTTVPVRGKNLFCMARDNDDRAPFVLTTLNGQTIQKLRDLIWNRLDECQTVLRNVRPYRETAIFCGARDNDGRAPFVALELNMDTFQVRKGTELFNTIQKCNEFLGTR